MSKPQELVFDAVKTTMQQLKGSYSIISLISHVRLLAVLEASPDIYPPGGPPCIPRPARHPPPRPRPPRVGGRAGVVLCIRRLCVRAARFHKGAQCFRNAARR